MKIASGRSFCDLDNSRLIRDSSKIDHLNCAGPSLPGANADHVLQGRHENLAVANHARSRAFHDGFDHRLDEIFRNRDGYENFWQEVHGVFRSAVSLRVALLPAKSANFGNGQAGYSQRVHALLYLVKLRWSDYGINSFHLLCSLFASCAEIAVPKNLATANITANQLDRIQFCLRG